MSKRSDSLRVVLEREMGNDSMLNIMHKFVQAVSIMDDTILVPSRLKDMSVNRTDQPQSLNMNSFLSHNSSSDLYGFYKMLNTIKNELVGGSSCLTNGEDNANNDTPFSVPPTDTNDNEQATQIAALFHQHMAGLFSSLKDMTHAAKYLTSRYQEELGDNTMPSRLSSVIL